MSQPPPSTPLPSAKRRRIDHAASTLKKPFRSPLLAKPTPNPSSPCPSPSVKLPPSTTTTPAAKTPIKPPTLPRPSTTTTTTPRIPTQRTIQRTTHADPDLLAAQKLHASLTARMRETRRSLETAQQALSLEEATGKDVELEAAVQRWRMAARAAAESLFALAGDRVNKLGGPAGEGWRVLLKGGGGGGGGGGSWGWDEEVSRRESDGGGDDDGEDEGLGGEEVVERVGKEEEGEWGMGLMLKCLGIPAGMLGWDPEGECWRSVEEMEGVRW